MRRLLVVLAVVLGMAGLVAVASAHMGNGGQPGMQGYGPGSGWTGGMTPGWMHGSGRMGQGMMGQGWMGGTGMGPGWMHGSGYRNGPGDAPSVPDPSTKLPPRDRDSNVRSDSSGMQFEPR